MLFLDCEFNGHKGHLISIGIVADDGDEFYHIYDGKTPCNEWVTQNVITKLGTATYPQDKVRELLHDFLRKHAGEPIIADSPADFWYLLDLCHEVNKEGKYRYISLDLKMEFIISGPYMKDNPNPHHALSDAKALRDWYNANLRRPSNT